MAVVEQRGNANVVLEHLPREDAVLIEQQAENDRSEKHMRQVERQVFKAGPDPLF